MTGDTHVVPCGDPEHCAAGGECIDYADELADPPAGTGPRPEALAAVTDAVRLVEDAIDATCQVVCGMCSVAVPTDRTGLAIVEALVEAGWLPPEPDPDVRAYDAAKAADTGVRVPLTDLVAEALDELDEPGP